MKKDIFSIFSLLIHYLRIIDLAVSNIWTLNFTQPAIFLKSCALPIEVFLYIQFQSASHSLAILGSVLIWNLARIVPFGIHILVGVIIDLGIYIEGLIWTMRKADHLWVYKYENTNIVNWVRAIYIFLIILCLCENKDNFIFKILNFFQNFLNFSTHCVKYT